jgi:hypothetical protein
MNGQYLDQMSQAFNNYCNVTTVPNLGAAPIVIVVLMGVVPILFFTALGESILVSAGIGAALSALFAFLFWLAYRIRAGASERFNAYIAADGGMGLFSDFAMAQSFEADQFRLGRYYLFIKNGAVLRCDSIADIVRQRNNYQMLLTGVYLTIKVKDEHGSMACPLCTVPVLKAGEEIDMIRRAVMQRRMQ